MPLLICLASLVCVRVTAAQAEPSTLPSNGMQREALATYPGAVALVNLEDVKAGMKVLKVEGRMPGEPGYSLN